MPPPARREFLTFSEEEDKLSKAPQQVSSDEEPPIEMTSRSMIGCSTNPLQSLPPKPITELVKKEDIIVEGTTLNNKEKRRGKLEIKEHKEPRRAQGKQEYKEVRRR